ncbi:peptide chain release factor N(5)-glutamine methyltransferase [Sporolactobacillus laevolacticus]|uniref:peptide chain release factor N(5)-glutamine methyltransferase n=1 Tax=Sporolactobacillus laevolacticus TaxID=33018 RepID=UPI0025B4CB31|nr:peptide chain release factor N(5)-glutamine methyltransferase [Sporolactobacillus laevolacticus]MDN3955258.1 peptide chain release factor N(5)-glutamine methyltransferase [Sporolactobacillus laevolacticus]
MTEKRYELLNWASALLKAHHRDTNIGEILLCERLQISRTALLAGLREPVSDQDASWVRECVSDHVYHGTPVQYMIGSAPFYGRSFKVTPDVLIPRQETEELVWRVGQWADRYFSNQKQLAVCDIGTGSGAIAVTLALEHPEWRVTAVDVSAKALDVARQNAALLGAKVNFRQGDLLEPLNGESFDLLVSNPPYITSQEMDRLDDTVSHFEPHLALFGGEDGLDFYRRIINDLPLIFGQSPYFIAAFEIGAYQGKAVKELIHSAFPHHIESLSIEKDIAGYDRNVLAVLRKPAL